MANNDDNNNGDESEWSWSDSEDIIEEHEFEAEGWDEVAGDPEAASRVVKALEGLVPDVLKKTITSGVGSIAGSEDRIRSLLSDKKVAREVVGYLIGQADATKRELFRVISREIRHFLEDMDFGGEIAKILTTLSFEVRMQVRFIENEDAVRPRASGRVSVKDERKGKEAPSSEMSEAKTPEAGRPSGEEEIFGEDSPLFESSTPKDKKDRWDAVRKAVKEATEARAKGRAATEDEEDES